MNEKLGGSVHGPRSTKNLNRSSKLDCKALKALIKEISLLNIQILQLHVKVKREKRRR